MASAVRVRTRVGVVRLLVDSVTVTAAVAVAVEVLVGVYVIVINSVAVLLGSTDTVIVDSTPPLAVMAVAHGVGMGSSVSSNPDSVARVATISVVGKLQISVVVSVVNGSVAQVVTSVSLALMTHVSSSKRPVLTPRFLPGSGHADEGGRIGVSWLSPGREGRKMGFTYCSLAPSPRCRPYLFRWGGCMGRVLASILAMATGSRLGRRPIGTRERSPALWLVAPRSFGGLASWDQAK